MTQTAVENLKRQVIPLQWLNAEGNLTLYLLTDRQRIVINNASVSEDILDKEAAGYIKVSSTSDTVTTGFTS